MMKRLYEEIEELKSSFDECDFGGGETKRLFQIIEELQKDIEWLENRKDEVLVESGKRWTKLLKIQDIIEEE